MKSRVTMALVFVALAMLCAFDEVESGASPLAHQSTFCGQVRTLSFAPPLIISGPPVFSSEALALFRETLFPYLLVRSIDHPPKPTI